MYDHNISSLYKLTCTYLYLFTYVIHVCYQILLNVVLVLAVLKKNYTKLCQCLPQNYMKTIDKLRLMGVPDDYLNMFTMLPTADRINDAIVGCLMVVINSDELALQFCDTMDELVDSKSSKTHIERLRNGK